jgi:hypothetical protein
MVQQIFWGTLFSDTDDYLLEGSDGIPTKVDFFVDRPDLALFVTNEGLDRHQQVSILGHMGEDPRLGLKPVIIAENIASHKDIALCAFELSSSSSGSALDNWLQAERQLLAR